MLKRLAAAAIGLSIAACTEEPGPGVAPESLPTEVEAGYQEREALRYAVEQLELEAAAAHEVEGTDNQPVTDSRVPVRRPE